MASSPCSRHQGMRILEISSQKLATASEHPSEKRASKTRLQRDTYSVRAIGVLSCCRQSCAEEIPGWMLSGWELSAWEIFGGKT